MLHAQPCHNVELSQALQTVCCTNFVRMFGYWSSHQPVDEHEVGAFKVAAHVSVAAWSLVHR